MSEPSPSDDDAARTVERLRAVLLDRTRGPSPVPGTENVRVALDVEGTEGWTLHIDGSDLSLQVGERDDVDTTIVTDATTLLAVYEGERSGVEAFLSGDLRVRGNLELSLRLMALYHRDDAPSRFPLPHDVDAGGHRTFYLDAGDGPPVVLLHGLGATNASLLPVVWDLAQDHRVIAPDLPGFGGSDKPLLRPLHAAFFADWLVALLDELGIERANLVGNSLGGRVAIEVGLRHPDRVDRLVLLAPSPAWLRGRDMLWLVRILRPEVTLLPVPLIPRGRVLDGLRNMFHDPDRVSDHWLDAAADEFLRVYGTARGRRAFFSAARQIYLEDPYEGRGRFWSRLPDLAPPALFVWGQQDPLVPPKFARHVEEALPAAESIVLERCGHVPQYEHPQRTNELVRKFVNA